MKKSKVTRSLLAACSVVALSAVMYGCSSGHSDADLQNAADQATQAAEEAAAEAARKAAEEAEEEKRKAVEAAEQSAADEAEKSARVTLQTNAITEAISAAEDALGMVELGASHKQIMDAKDELQDLRDAIEAAVDVEDTSMYTARANDIENELTLAEGFVAQDRAAKKTARAGEQKDAIDKAIEAANDAVAKVDVDDATAEDIEAAAKAAAEAVQAARDAIDAAVDIDDTSMYSDTVDDIEASIGTDKNTALAAYQSGKIEAAIDSAESAVDKVDLNASPEVIKAAEDAVQKARDYIEAAVNVDDTSMYTADVDALDRSLTTATGLASDYQEGQKADRADDQKDDISDAIEDAEDAVALVVVGADDTVINDAKVAIQKARDAIDDAVDVDDTGMYSDAVDGIEDDLEKAEMTVLVERAKQETIDSALADERGKASAAMDAAKTAADNAGTDANDAESARENIATMQTGEKSGASAEAARDHADKAMAAYEKAKAASEAADEAETVAAAVAARIDAERAKKDAEDYAMKAGEDGGNAEDAVTMELFIDGTIKRVGDTSVDAAAKAKSVTVDGQTTVTGLIASENPKHSVDAVPGVPFAANTDPTDDVEYVQAVAARDLTIGKTVDSSDDMARLMLVTHYAGSDTVKVYAEDTGTDLTGTTMGRVSIAAGTDGTSNTDDDTYADLTKVGTYYLAGERGQSPDGLTNADVIGDEATGETVYSYVDSTNNDAVVHVVLQETDTETPAGGDTVTTYTYQRVDITALASDATADGTAEEVGVTAALPVPTAYKHIHFGVWAGLSDAAKNGTQDIVDLGIGFVQSVGSGPTPVTGDNEHLPATGTAEYEGNWVAAIQEADVDGNGDISLEHGAATLEVDFGKDEITATLGGLATLEGDISNNEFSGSEVTVSASNSFGLNAGDEDDFSGSFSGGFFGSEAAEAGGIFDFTSEDMEDGAFRGAFGGDKQ